MKQGRATDIELMHLKITPGVYTFSNMSNINEIQFFGT